jgi:hypothetical protein
LRCTEAEPIEPAAAAIPPGRENAPEVIGERLRAIVAVTGLTTHTLAWITGAPEKHARAWLEHFHPDWNRGLR